MNAHTFHPAHQLWAAIVVSTTDAVLPKYIICSVHIVLDCFSRALAGGAKVMCKSLCGREEDDANDSEGGDGGHDASSCSTVTDIMTPCWSLSHLHTPQTFQDLPLAISWA